MLDGSRAKGGDDEQIQWTLELIEYKFGNKLIVKNIHYLEYWMPPVCMGGGEEVHVIGELLNKTAT